MPFDRDSFLKGVITGMRLPRTPGGRPPFEPVPSGKYILAEDGRNIVKENVTREDVSIYESGVWYQAELFTVRYRFEYRRDGSDIPAKIIFAKYPSSSAYPYAWYFSGDSRIGYAKIYKDRDGEAYDNGNIGIVYNFTRSGKTIYTCYQIAVPGGGGHWANPPIDAIITVQPSISDVIRLCWDIWYGPTNPLITD